ncbi:hypothetical protein ACSV4D_03555 [Flavobacterium sp. ARAG 55.4]|uniref:hypothetical protein n=1 Tax=Flavobacterium sp. ARAG 55.4 TaxID=3451357 RepID=UPI003F468692
MKKKFILINVFLSMAVLYSILFQAIHAYGHYSEEIAKKTTYHHSDNKVEINQNHSIFEKCSTCDFNFSSFTTTDFYVFPFCKNNTVKVFTSLFTKQHLSFFTGSLFALRAPPLY